MRERRKRKRKFGWSWRINAQTDNGAIKVKDETINIQNVIRQ